MKRTFVLTLALYAVACGAHDQDTLTAPSATTVQQLGASATGDERLFTEPIMGGGAHAALGDTRAAPVPFHILQPVLFPMRQGVVVFPPRNEPNTFFQNLQALYRDVLRRPLAAPTHVDAEGQNVWLTEYFRFYLNGCPHEEASSRTLTEITTGATLPTCGAETLAFPPRDLPNEFQNRLQATYRDVLRRPQTFSYVDSEGANVWLAQYLRFRVSGGCNHTTAESKVFTEIRGGGVQPDCGPPFTRSGIGNTVFDLPAGIARIRIIGTYTSSSSNFIVRIGGRLVVNELLGSFWGQTRHEGIYLIVGTIVEITSSSGVSWSFEEVR